MNLKKIKKNVLTFLGLNVLSFIANILVKTYRIKIVNDAGIKKYAAESKPFIVAFWHGKMIIPWYIHRKYKIAALVSRSKDGEILTRLLKSWNYKVIRGSSHIGGKEALKIMENTISENYSLAITPDGPTGPVNKMKAGAVVLAERKSIPLFLIGTASKKYKELNSWDQFQIPKLFTKISVIYSDPIYVDKEASREEISNLIYECEDKLNNLQKEAETIVRNHA
ncbi:MAG: lysophospholipid acyltransferase family protein [Melioribacteraceae bacterium]|nr:lysophospholipid acyltransferase family protein [Melioribacteraceae bacterium]